MDIILSWYTKKCKEASFNRLGVMAVILLVQTCLLIPATLLAMSMNGNSPIHFILIAVFSFALLVSLLGDMPSKVVLPVFGASVLIHLFIILSTTLL